MECILCGSQTKVMGNAFRVKFENGGVKRRRECKECLTRFETTEKVNYEKLDRYTLNKLHEKVERRAIT